MLSTHKEYQLMYEAEETLWWYRVLHEYVVAAIQRHAGASLSSVAILDAGCGTGGMLQFLKTKGYEAISGFDYAISAVNFARQRGLAVEHLSMANLAERYAPESADIIICNDVVYALETPLIAQAFHDIAQVLKPGGLLITNNNAFQCFYGTHDIAVGGKHRFTLKDMQAYAAPTPLRLVQHTYWSILLSPLILAVRQWQQFQLRRGSIDLEKVQSDVHVPPAWLNNAFYQLNKIETALWPTRPFGSSLFTVFKKT